MIDLIHAFFVGVIRPVLPAVQVSFEPKIRCENHQKKEVHNYGKYYSALSGINLEGHKLFKRSYITF
jgi:hypothetical protein